MNDERLLRLPEVMARLSLSKTAIYKLMSRGELVPVRLGGSVRFPSAVIDKMVRGENVQGVIHVEVA